MATALELKREGWKPYLEAGVHFDAYSELTPEDRQEREDLLARIRKAAAMLKSRFGVRRVILFGSLAHESWFLPHSDVDLAIEWLDSEDYWHAWKLVEELIDDRPVDFIEIETSRESLKKDIERYGVEL